VPSAAAVATIRTEGVEVGAPVDRQEPIPGEARTSKGVEASPAGRGHMGQGVEALHDQTVAEAYRGLPRAIPEIPRAEVGLPNLGRLAGPKHLRPVVPNWAGLDWPKDLEGFPT
jgi:hypothetical protein